MGTESFVFENFLLHCITARHVGGAVSLSWEKGRDVSPRRPRKSLEYGPLGDRSLPFALFVVSLISILRTNTIILFSMILSFFVITE